MKVFYFVHDRQLMRAAAALILLFLLGSCSYPPKNRFQGYVEGEFVYVASPLSGTLESLRVRRGEQVQAGDPLFALDETPEKAAREQIEAALVLSEAEYARQDKLFHTGATATQDLDRARSTRDQDKRRLTQTDWSFLQKRQSAPHAEYTPPVIYSKETRDKLVFMVEAVFDPATAANLHPGQPVDVQFESKS